MLLTIVLIFSVVLEKGNVIKDLETNPATLKELEAHFAGSVMAAQEEE